MPVISQKWIERVDLQSNTTTLYLFGDNLIRKGLGGQASAMRGEPNAIGIATKRAPGMRDTDFFSDDDYDETVAEIALDFAPAKVHVALGGLLVIPTDGLGTGLSELPTRAPRIHEFIEAELERLREMGGE